MYRVVHTVVSTPSTELGNNHWHYDRRTMGIMTGGDVTDTHSREKATVLYRKCIYMLCYDAAIQNRNTDWKQWRYLALDYRCCGITSQGYKGCPICPVIGT